MRTEGVRIMKREDMELMLPAGSWESLAAALQTGCDAVYFGVGNLNMRSESSANFSPDDLAKIAETCRRQQVKTRMALNTIIYDEDVDAMRRSIRAAKQHGIDAVIASDMAAILCAREEGMPVHASTQLNIANRQAVRFFAGYCDVMVLARELTLEQVSAIAQFIESERITGPSGKPAVIEMFCHGALCMSVSGKCYLSLHHYNRSANRGRCVQVCRRAYSLTDNETGRRLEVDHPHLLSPKDLCTVTFLDRMAAAGVRVFKVEGRARSPEYVKTVGQCYHEALTACCEGGYHDQAKEQWLKRLGQVFNRGFWDGYYLGKTMSELTDSAGSKATVKKEYVALCSNYFAKIGVGEFLMQAGTLSAGDTVLIIGNTTGVVEMKVAEIRVDMQAAKQAAKGEIFSMPVTQPIRRGDKLYVQVAADNGQ
ncbi:MAG: U32 family peptidase [Bacteroidales bacterium]|jgi:putative protease|nr:U32 family peptidase [Bacteroidales bacterium]